jgi:hypothetical protein
MIPIASGLRVWIATGHTDMRRYAERMIMHVRAACNCHRGFLAVLTRPFVLNDSSLAGFIATEAPGHIGTVQETT